MEIKTNPIILHEVEDFDVVPNTMGPPLQFTMDKNAGDTYDCNPAEQIFATFTFVEKPSPLDPEIIIPPMEFTIFFQNTFSIQKVKRMAQAPTLEQREQWQTQLKEFTGPKH